MNESKIRDPRMWEVWKNSGALGTYESSFRKPDVIIIKTGAEQLLLREIMGRPVNLEERAPGFENETLREAAGEYKTDQIVPALKYLVSDTPINEPFWEKAAYEDLSFDWEGHETLLFSNHGLATCMRQVLRGRMNISDLILDLSKLIGSAITDREEMLQFKQQIQDKVRDGIRRQVIWPLDRHNIARALRTKEASWLQLTDFTMPMKIG